ncbi:MAG TPA: hypothetical protein VGA27_08000 [Candidatus Binatia bacterium]
MTATRSYDQTPKTNRARNRKSNASRFKLSLAITCEAAIDHIGNYIGDNLNVPEHRGLEKHFGACADCSAFLSTYKKTIELTRAFLNPRRSEERPVNFKLRLSSSR